MAKVKIFIEAKDANTPESRFLSAILDTLLISTDQYEILHTNGYTNLMDSPDANNIDIMKANTDDDGKNLVIFDADTDVNGGGFEIRRDYLLQRRDTLGVDFELFLWPNNKDDGDVEVLMESIARKDLYPELFDCFSKYEHCMSQRKKENGEAFYTTPNRKGKLHTYINSLPLSNTKKKKFGSGEWLWTSNEIWDLNSDNLIPIKEFLKRHLS